jgi:hypothetical protein
MGYKIIIEITILYIYGTVLFLILFDIERKRNYKTREEQIREEARAIKKVFPLWFVICNFAAILLVLSFNYFDS